MNFDRTCTFKKKNLELKRMEQEVEEDDICLDNILKDLEKKTNFFEFLPYSEAIKNEVEPDDILPSPFSPISNYRQLFGENKKKMNEKLISMKTMTLQREKTQNFTLYQSKALYKQKKSLLENSASLKKKTKLDELFDLQQNELYFSKKNTKKILPKINKNISHSISALMNLK